ncbi:DUF6262 family protein [Mycobacterium sp.]|uniref:DUF6262 family protein n=1 Tax=Mycobacterium sp. TaxID=1785 RepID=UPI003F9B7A47
MSRSIEALQQATRRRRETAEKAVTAALREARKANVPITFTRLAATAGVSTDFIYRHPALRGQVEALRRVRNDPGAATQQNADTDAAESTVVRRLSQELVELRHKHHEQVNKLQRALAAAHGELLELRRRLADRPTDDCQ